jgi:hypothetical protein
VARPKLRGRPYSSGARPSRVFSLIGCVEEAHPSGSLIPTPTNDDRARRRAETEAQQIREAAARLVDERAAQGLPTDSHRSRCARAYCRDLDERRACL